MSELIDVLPLVAAAKIEEYVVWNCEKQHREQFKVVLQELHRKTMKFRMAERMGLWINVCAKTAKEREGSTLQMITLDMHKEMASRRNRLYKYVDKKLKENEIMTDTHEIGVELKFYLLESNRENQGCFGKLQ